jgi:sugar diacid utilization regulator
LGPKNVQTLLDGLSDSPQLRPFWALVAPLQKRDRERNSDLVRTLRAFFASGANLSRTADGLLLHRNSVTYRLERVRELTGLNYRDPRARLAMQHGLLAIGKERSKNDEDEHP